MNANSNQQYFVLLPVSNKSNQEKIKKKIKKKNETNLITFRISTSTYTMFSTYFGENKIFLC